MKVQLSATSDGEIILKILPETNIERDILLHFSTEIPAIRTSDIDTHIVVFSKRRLPESFRKILSRKEKS